MTHTTGKLLPLVLVLVAAVITPLLLSENAEAQDVISIRVICLRPLRKVSRQHYQGAQEIQTAGRTTLTCLLMRVLGVKAMSSSITRRMSSLIPSLPLPLH